MENRLPEDFDIEKHLAQFAPPSIPNESWDCENAPVYAVRTWKRYLGASIVAGLMTEPSIQANGIRLDWLQRLILAKAVGERKPSPRDVYEALNDGLEKARVLRLEDPPEDLCCDVIVTRHGMFRIFTGHWESPGPYTQTLLDAFEALSAGPRKSTPLTQAYALLRLSEALAERSGVERLSLGGGQPGDVLNVPEADVLSTYASRVRFTNHELRSLGINRSDLEPFFLEKQHLQYIGSSAPGDSPLEFYPLVQSSGSVTVASPAGISMAIRAMLVAAAKRGGPDRLLLLRMLEAQERYC